MNEAADPFVDVNDIHTYYGSSHVLHGVSLTIGRGESVCLMGRNGTGKTTTIRSIFGLTPPHSGNIRIGGRDMTGAAPHLIARLGLALAPEGRAIFPNLTVEENLLMAARPGRGGGAGWTLERTLGLFPRLGARLRNMGDQISGGEQQMLSIGRALMTNPDLLVLDEACEGLAPLIRKEIWSVIAGVKLRGIATLIVDKDVETLAGLCDRCVVLAKGTVVYSAAAGDLAANPAIRAEYLGL